MFDLPTWLGAPRRLIMSFVLLLLLPAATVVWLGVQLLARDRGLESQQLRDRRESACDRLIASLQQALTATERRLAGAAGTVALPMDDDAMLMIIHHGEIEAYPKDRLLYYPVLPGGSANRAAEFEAGEQIEFDLRDYLRAATMFRQVAASTAGNVRAGALMRSARNWRKAGNSEEALRTYDKLAGLHDAQIDGVPADLAARRARCVLLQELNRTSDLREEARALRVDLLAAHWVLDRGTFLEYAKEFEDWNGVKSNIDPEREALAEAADWLWQQQKVATSGRSARQFEGTAITVLWQPAGDGVNALVAGTHFQQHEWFDGLRAQFDSRELQVALAGVDDQPLLGKPPADLSATVRRAPLETSLPWTVLVTNTSPASAQFASRRNLLVSGLAILIVLVLAGGYFALRAMSREFAVAQLQSDFVSSVSHEFRTPLTSLRQFTDLLNESDEVPAEKRRSFYNAQGRATERLQRLVESLLDFGRMEAGKHPYKRERLDAARVVRGVVDEFQHEAAAKEFAVESSIEPDSGAIDADPDAFARALWNLLDNAVKYSGESRTIWVHVARQYDWVAISVRDRGLGIPRHEQTEVFRKFVRGADARAHGIKGTGIGLAMVRHIIDGHGGTLRVESVPGEGSTFTILLPGRDGWRES